MPITFPAGTAIYSGRQANAPAVSTGANALLLFVQSYGASPPAITAETVAGVAVANVWGTPISVNPTPWDVNIRLSVYVCDAPVGVGANHIVTVGDPNAAVHLLPINKGSGGVLTLTDIAEGGQPAGVSDNHTVGPVDTAAGELLLSACWTGSNDYGASIVNGASNGWVICGDWTPEYKPGGSVARKLATDATPVSVVWDSQNNFPHASVLMSFAVVGGGTAPSITDQPDAATVTEGATATFTVAASGTGTLSYQWQVNTGSSWANVSTGTGGTTASYTTPATTVGMSGYQYRCIVTGDTAPPATSSAAPLTVNAAAVPPAVTTHPASQSVVSGTTATFTAAFSGSPAPTVQWQRNPGGNTAWADIAGATGLSYTTPATTLTGGSANNGDAYRAVGTNAAGNAVTNAATLTVTAASVAPTITAHPQNSEVVVGQAATFSVVAAGTAPLAYQWRRNGVNISGANSSSYTTPATLLGDDGDTFDVVVSNGTAPNATSNTAVLTVSAGFDVDLEPMAIGNTGSGVRANQNFSFSAWRNGVVGSLASATLVEGSGTTGADGVATIQLPFAGVWRVEREFADGGDCVEYVTVA